MLNWALFLKLFKDGLRGALMSLLPLFMGAFTAPGAWITAIGGAYGFNHDLRVLVLTLRELGCDVEKFRHLIILNPFAVQMRYEPLETVDEQLDRPALRKEVQELHTHVQSVVALLKSKVWTTQ